MNKIIEKLTKEFKLQFQDAYTAFPETINEVEQFLSKALQEVAETERRKVLSQINPMDLIEPCVAECDGEQHAYHSGTWDAHIKLQKILEALSNPQKEVDK